MVSRLWPDPRYLHRGISRGILRLSVDPVNCPNCHHPVDEHIAVIMCNLIGCTCESDALDDIEISYKDLREKTEVREPGIRRPRKPQNRCEPLTRPCQNRRNRPKSRPII